MRFSIIAGSHVPLGVGEPGTGILLRNPQTATGLWFGMATDFGPGVGVGEGLRFINPQTPTGLVFGSPTFTISPPIPVEAPTINLVVSTGATTLRVYYTDNQTSPSDYFNVKVRDVVANTQIQDNATTSNPYNVQGLTADTEYEITMTASYGGAVSGLSGGVKQTTQSVVIPGDFYPEVAHIDFEQFNEGDQIIVAGSGGSAYDGPGTGATWDDPANISEAKQWYRQVYIDDGQPPQNFTNTTGDLNEVRSGTKSGVIYIVRKDEMATAPPYNSAMGVALNVKDYHLTDGTEYWYKLDIKLPADFDPHTGVTTLKMFQHSTWDPSTQNSTGAQFLNMYASSGVYPGGWALDTAEQRKDLPDVQQSVYFLPEGHPDITGKPWIFNDGGAFVIPSRFGWVRDQWMRIEIYSTVAHDPANSVFRMWMNEELAIEHYGMPNLRLPNYEYSFFKFFSYWNGARDTTNIPKCSTFRYEEPNRILVDNVVVTTGDAPPPNRDLNNNLMIGGWPNILPNPDPDPPPAYEGFYDFDGGTNGALANTDASGYDTLLGPGNLVHFSNAQWNSSPLSSRFTLPANFTSDSGAKVDVSPSISMGEFWIQCKVFVPSGFVWPKLANGARPSEGLKFLRADYRKSDLTYLGAWDCYIYDNGLYAAGAMTTFGGNALQSVYSSTEYRGMGTIKYSQWMTVEYYVKLDTGNGGIFRAWLDNELVGEFTNFSSAQTAADELYQLKVFSGPQPSVNPNLTQYLYVDDIIILSDDNAPTKEYSPGVYYIGGTAPPVFDPDFVPDYDIRFTDGVAGQTAVGTDDSFDHYASNVLPENLTFSDEVAPWSEGLVAKAVRPANKYDWGGGINRLNGRYAVGDEFWIRTVTWYPSGFLWCGGCTEGVKFHRMYIEPDGGNWGFFLNGDNGSSSDGMGVSSSVGYCTRKEFYSRYDQWADQSTENGFPPCEVQSLIGHYAQRKIGPDVPEGEWVLHETYIKLHPTDGAHRYYTNGTLVFKEDGIKTCDSMSSFLKSFAMWTYHNGGSGLPQDHAYVDSITITGGDAPPPNTDSEGHPVIGYWKAGSTGGSGGSFSPEYIATFESGSKGQLAEGTDALPYAASLSVYDDTYLKETSSMSCRVGVIQGTTGSGDYGGGFGGSQGTSPYPVVYGKSLWYKLDIYVPDAWTWGSAGSKGPWRHTIHKTGGVHVGYADLIQENSRMQFFVEPGYWPNQYPDPLPKGRWVTLESQLKLSTVQGEGIYRVWQDGALIAESLGPNCPSTDCYISATLLFNYFDGTPYFVPETQNLWVDNIIICTDDNLPPSTDANGNPMIGDWTP